MFKFTPEMTAKLKAGHYTAGIVLHTMDAGWPKLQIEGITNTLKDFGVEVVAVTDAKFQPGQQIADLEQMIARKPDVIFSIPIDPQSEAAAYKKAAAAGIKLVFMDNVPVGMTPGKDYVSVTASDNEQNAAFAAHQLADAIGKKGEVGIITLVYDYYYSVAARKVGALKAFKEYPDIKVADIGTFTSPEKAYSVANRDADGPSRHEGHFCRLGYAGAAGRRGGQDPRPPDRGDHQRSRSGQRAERRARGVSRGRRPAPLRPGRRRSAVGGLRSARTWMCRRTSRSRRFALRRSTCSARSRA